MQSAIMVPAPSQSRRNRNPQHSFYVKHAPFVIQPFFVAPVLPGETLQNLSFQARVLTNPIVEPLIGWWCEHYFFYCKHRDMADSSYLQAMMLDYTNSLSSGAEWLSAAGDNWAGVTNAFTGYNFVRAAMKPIIETYFRDEGRAWDSATLESGLPAAYVEGNSWMDSITSDSERDTEVDVKIPVDAGPTPDEVSYLDFLKAKSQYELLAQSGLVNATYEDYLRSYGVRIQQELLNKPELIRYSRQWQYPSSHVQPNATTPALSDVTSAVSWSIAERADKQRFFREPGVLIGCSVVRPKMYREYGFAPATNMMTDALAWLPAILRSDVQASWRKVTDGANDIFGGNAVGNWWWDAKDLFLYGDQFRTGAYNNDYAPNINPGAANSREVDQAAVDALFASGDATAGVRQDGVVRLHISSQIGGDTSPRGTLAG